MAANDIPRPARVPAGANAAGDGVVLGSGQVAIDAFIDFQCPFCRMFEEQSGATLDRLVGEGNVSLTYHPLGFLDPLSTTHYSSRSSAASGCAADAGRFAPFKDALFANQPPEGSAGLSDDQLIEIGHSVGIQDEGFERCVRAHLYLPWTAYVTERAMGLGVSGTPTVLVEGVPVPANPGTIEGAVSAVMDASVR
jgi:protein-disulfide isomerase